MKCNIAKADLIGYLYREMPEDALKEMAQHVEQCPACRAELQTLEETGQILQAWPPETPQFQFVFVEEPRPAWLASLARHSLAVGTSGVAAVILIALALILWKNAPDPQSEFGFDHPAPEVLINPQTNDTFVVKDDFSAASELHWRRLPADENQVRLSRDIDRMANIMDNALAPEYQRLFRHRTHTLGTYKNGLGAVFFLNSDSSPAERQGKMFRIIERLEDRHAPLLNGGDITHWSQDIQGAELQALQTALLEVVGNYSHTLRPLPESESVVIAVDIDRKSPQDGRHGGFILQVNKKDLDTYNRGQMGIQEFRKRAIIRRY